MAAQLQNLSADRVVTIRLPSETHKALSHLAIDNGLTVSSILRREAVRLTKHVETTAEGQLILKNTR